MSLILNIESATDICSINISRDGVIIAEREIVGNSHAEKMTLLIQECLEMGQIKISDLDAVAISNGPGSYTSLRIGASTAKGICYALDIPLIAVDTLESLARAAFAEVGDEAALYCPMIDARRMEVYAAVYEYSAEKNALENIEPMQPKIIDADAYSDYFQKNKKIIFCGNGAPKCEETFRNANVIFLPLVNSARYLSYISYHAFVENRFVDTAYHTPQYLKAPNITVPKKQL
jgi:tRNA threonylcarbamoyladenosine biosynthesis protein TsaB